MSNYSLVWLSSNKNAVSVFDGFEVSIPINLVFGFRVAVAVELLRHARYQ